LSPQLEPFGKSDDDFGEFTFEVGLLFCSVRASRTVHVVLADGPRRACSSGVLRVLARLSFRPVVALSFHWERFRTVRSSGRTVRGCLADSPRAPRGRSVISGASLVVLCVLSDGPRRRDGQSAVLVQTVHGSRPDGPRGQCGRSAPPGRMVRQSLCVLLLGSIPSFLSCASACASRNRS
jgi:hypothetical protein